MRFFGYTWETVVKYPKTIYILEKNYDGLGQLVVVAQNGDLLKIRIDHRTTSWKRI